MSNYKSARSTQALQVFRARARHDDELNRDDATLERAFVLQDKAPRSLTNPTDDSLQANNLRRPILTVDH